MTIADNANESANVGLPIHRIPPEPDRSMWRVVDTMLPGASGVGPLNSMALAVKDLIAVAGHRMGAGNPTWLTQQQIQPSSANCLARLLQAGAHVAGIAQTDEFAYSLAGVNDHYGTPPNPAAPDRIPGGSTSGAASAVALHQADIGLGTDTAGSIRVPASYQGLIGLRSTHGVIDLTGVLGLAPSFDTIGWLTTDIDTCESVANVLLPTTPRLDIDPDMDMDTGMDTNMDRAPGKPLNVLRLPTIDGLAHEHVREELNRCTTQFADAGDHREITAELDPATLRSWCADFRTWQAFRAWQLHGPWISSHPGAVGTDIARRFAVAAAVEPQRADQARGRLDEARRRIRSWLEDAIIVIPSAPDAAPARDANHEEIEQNRSATLLMTCLASIAGVPAISLPLLRSVDNLPVGLCIVGAANTDLTLIAVARRFLEAVR